jgi:hypothetical protein
LPANYWLGPEDSGWETFVNRDLGFEIQFPAGTKVLSSAEWGSHWDARSFIITHYFRSTTPSADGACGGTSPDRVDEQEELLSKAKTKQDALKVIEISKVGLFKGGGLVSSPIKIAYALSGCENNAYAIFFHDKDWVELYPARGIQTTSSKAWKIFERAIKSVGTSPK